MRVDSGWALFWIFILVAVPSLGQVAGPVSYWSANGSAAASIGQNHGTVHGGVTFLPGIAGLAFNLDGKKSYILVSHPTFPPLDFDVHSFSLSLWMRTNFRHGGNGTDFLIAKFDRARFFEYSLQYNSNLDGQAMFAVAAQGRGESVSGGPALGDNNWHHIVGVRNGTVLFLYVDCVQVARSNCIGCDAINSTGSNNVTIGGRENADFDPYFVGLIDEVAVYNRALSDAEVKAVYQGTSGKQCPKKTC